VFETQATEPLKYISGYHNHSTLARKRTRSKAVEVYSGEFASDMAYQTQPRSQY